MSYRSEVTELLQKLLRIDTVNPPGNETRAAELLRDYLARDGIRCELYAAEPHRANLVARLPGGDGPTVMLTGHTDTVIADAAEWSRDPWSGDLIDGEIWGRGALDMKGHVAAAVVAFASLAREQVSLPGDVVLVIVADEEVGVDHGMAWVTAHHPEPLRADFAVNEGGGERFVLGGKPYYLCTVAEKMTAPFIVRLRGKSGHASDPYAADNALLKLPPVLEALGKLEPPRTLIPEVKAFLEVVLGEVPPLEVALDRARTLSPLAAELIAPLLSATLSPTMVEASRQLNVIPGVCELRVDCRMLPEMTTGAMESIIRAGVRATGSSSGSSGRCSAGRGLRSRPRCGARSRRGSTGPSRAPFSRRSPRAASPTATTSAPDSAPAPTGSSPSARWTPRMRGASFTRRTRESRSMTSSSASTCSVTLLPPSRVSEAER